MEKTNAQFRADLHCHSIFSDGSDSPSALLKMASDVGLQGLSITDHDSLDAYSPELFSQAEKLQIQLLTGIELSTEFMGEPIHVLGYGYDPNSTGLKQFLVEMQKRRADRNRAILLNLSRHRMPITEEELCSFAYEAGSKRTIGRPHIALLMVKKGYVSSAQEAFERYLKEGAPCYASGKKYHPSEAIQQIHSAKGKAVLAHPHFIKKSGVVKKLLELPLDGIECYYARVLKNLEDPWVRRAKEHHLIATGGSDYHGALKPHIQLGCSWVGEEVFNALLPKVD